MTFMSRRPLHYLAALIVWLALLSLQPKAQGAPYTVMMRDLPYGVHVSQTITQGARLMLIACTAPLGWTQASGWDLPQGFLRLRFVVSIPDEGVYDLIYDHIGRDGSTPLVIRMNGTRWYGASYNPIPQPHGASGSCWLDEQAVRDFEYQVQLDANWPG